LRTFAAFAPSRLEGIHRQDARNPKKARRQSLIAFHHPAIPLKTIAVYGQSLQSAVFSLPTALRVVLLEEAIRWDA
jgi:hypothetical protein